MAQGKPMGGFIAWRHENDRDDIKIPKRKKGSGQRKNLHRADCYD